MQRLGGSVICVNEKDSSAQKGESIEDTIQTMSCYCDAIVIRHPMKGSSALAASVATKPVINAGDGVGEHPTQALIDLFTVRQALAEARGEMSEGSGLSVFDGLEVLIIGDIRHSRVARSQILAYNLAGARVRVAAPGTLLPSDTAGWPIEVVDDLDEALGHADLVSVLRMQEERGSGSFVPSLHEFTATFGMTEQRASRLKPGALITHPGPMVRGVEIASTVADDARCLVRRQVSNGVPVRMAALFLALSAPGEGAHD